MRNIERNLFCEKKNLKYIKENLKVIFKVICLTIMIYQIISVTLIYMSFPFRVNLYLTDDQNKYLPSITVCIPFDFKCLILEKNKTFYIKYDEFSRIIPLENINCDVFYKTKNSTILAKRKCNQIANIISKIEINSFLKCYTYFQKRELFYNSMTSDYEINHIEFRFPKRMPITCLYQRYVL
jgi:hypothetical protein